jgi:hypothetical protein
MMHFFRLIGLRNDSKNGGDRVDDIIDAIEDQYRRANPSSGSGGMGSGSMGGKNGSGKGSSNDGKKR